MTIEPTALPGSWWLPDTRERTLSGELTYDDEGIRVSLLGTLLDVPQAVLAMSRSDEVYPLILGETTSGQPVTLENSRVLYTQVAFGPGQSTQRLAPEAAYLGAHVSSVDDLTWSRLKFRTRHMTEWLGAQSPSEQFQVLRAEKDGALVELIAESSVDGPPPGAPHVARSAGWQVTPQRPASLRDLVRTFMSPLQDLVTLCTASSSLVTGIEVIPAESPANAQDVEVLIDSHRVGAEVDGVLGPPQMLLPMHALSARFAEAIAAWLDAWTRFRSACSLLVGSEYARPDMFDNRIMNIAQAAEAFHRLRFATLERTQEQHDQRIHDVLQAAPDEYRDWLRRKLRFSNEVDLGRRLRELYEHAGEVATNLAPGREEFVKVLVATRNDLAHRGALDPEANKEVLYHAVESLKFILKACLIREMNFDGSDTFHLFARHRRYENEAEAGQRLWP